MVSAFGLRVMAEIESHRRYHNKTGTYTVPVLLW